MTTQNYQNHTKFKPDTRSQVILYLSVISLNILAFAYLCWYLYRGHDRIIAVLFTLTGIALFTGYFTFRSFSLKVQDRAIRAEENLRYYVLTGKLLDMNLNIRQIIALRFAPDEEFTALAERAVKENLSNDDIKKMVKNWKEDNHRA